MEKITALATELRNALQADLDGFASKQAEIQNRIALVEQIPTEVEAYVQEQLGNQVDVTPFDQAYVDQKVAEAVQAAKEESSQMIADLNLKLSQKDSDALEEAVADKLQALADKIVQDAAELRARSTPVEPQPEEPQPEPQPEVQG